MRETSIFEARIVRKEPAWWTVVLGIIAGACMVSFVFIINQIVEKVGARFFPCDTFMGYFFNAVHTCKPCIDSVTTSCNTYANIPIITPLLLAIIGMAFIFLIVRSENAQRVARSKIRNARFTPKISSSQIRNKRSKKQK